MRVNRGTSLEGNVRVGVEEQGSCGERRNVSESVEESRGWMSRRERKGMHLQ